MTASDTPLSFQHARGMTRIVPPGASRSWWQPQPANGYAEVILSPRNIRSVQPFSFGTQAVPPQGRVRLHAHDGGEEVLYVLRGRGTALVDGVAHPMEPGTTLYLGHNCSHSFVNDGDEEMAWAWFFLPGGLDDFFERIGRPRTAGQEAPEPFARPADVEAIERATVFARR